MQIPVQFNSRGKNVLGVLHLADESPKNSPTVILCYGLNGNRVENHRMSVLFGRLAEVSEINFFRFDYRGLGVSDGEFWEMSISSKVEDVVSAINFIKGCTDNNKQQIILLGFSDGARVAMDVLKLCPNIDAVCMWNPIFFPLPISNDIKASLRLTREPRTKKIVFPFEGVWSGTKHLREQKEIGDVLGDYLSFKGPKMSLFGSKDSYTIYGRQMLIEKNEEAEYKSKIITIENANHIFSHSSWVEEVLNNTISWIKEISNIECGV